LSHSHETPEEGKRENVNLIDQSDRVSIYQWSEIYRTKPGTLTTKESVWTQTVHNRRRQKRVKSSLIEHWRREWKSGTENTSHEKENETSLKKVKSYWKTKTNGGI
jgi:hypothetical protein